MSLLGLISSEKIVKQNRNQLELGTRHHLQYKVTCHLSTSHRERVQLLLGAWLFTIDNLHLTLFEISSRDTKRTTETKHCTYMSHNNHHPLITFHGALAPLVTDDDRLLVLPLPGDGGLRVASRQL